MKYRSKGNVNRQYYLPREVDQMLGKDAELIPNAFALVMFPKGSSPEKVLRSLAVIQHDLENQIFTEKIDRRRSRDPSLEGLTDEEIAEMNLQA